MPGVSLETIIVSVLHRLLKIFQRKGCNRTICYNFHNVQLLKVYGINSLHVKYVQGPIMGVDHFYIIRIIQKYNDFNETYSIFNAIFKYAEF